MIPQSTVDAVLSWMSVEHRKTPTFLFVPGALRSGVAALRRQLGGRISYAVKANPHRLVLSELVPLVDEFNVTNLHHLDTVLDLGVDPSRISWIHPVVTADTLAKAAERGVSRFAVDDKRGLRMVCAVTRKPKLTLRVMPPDTGEASRSLVRFGNAPDEVLDVFRSALDAGAEVEACSFFVGTAGAGMSAAEPFRRGIEQLGKLYEQLDGDRVALPVVNVGGGFPGSRSRFLTEHPEFFSLIREALWRQFGANVVAVSEPGRFLSEPAVAMVARVVADRVIGGRRLVYLDASSYGGLFEFCFIDHGGEQLAIQMRQLDGAPTRASVIGPIMDSFDVIRRDASLPPLREGDLVLMPNVGAYSWGYAAACEGLRPPELIEVPESVGVASEDAWWPR